MSARRSFDQNLADWLDEGPIAAPREDLAALLQAFPEVRQRRRIGREIQMPTIARLAVAAALVALVGGLAATQLNPSTIGPAASPAPTPGWAERFGLRTSTLFRHPFQYSLGGPLDFRIRSVDPDQHQFKIYDPVQKNYPRGVILKSATPLRQDVCTQVGGELLEDYTPRQFVDYLKGLPGFRVTEQPPTTVDGREALVVDVDQLPRGDRPCDDIWVWDGKLDLSFSGAGEPGGWNRRFLAFDVDGDTVLAIIQDADANMPDWIPTAMAFVDSIHFLPREPAASPTR